MNPSMRNPIAIALAVIKNSSVYGRNKSGGRNIVKPGAIVHMQKSCAVLIHNYGADVLHMPGLWY